MKLTDKDWALLLPGESVKLGKQDLHIVPLNLDALKGVSMRLGHVVKSLGNRKITFDNCMKEKLSDLAEVLLSEAPDILAAASGLETGDLKKLPAFKLVEILDVVLRVNASSKEGFEKNLKSLVAAIPAAINGASEILSSFSLDAGTDGKTSGNTASVK